MIACPGCGAGMHFDIASQKLICDYCGTTVLPEEMEAGKESKGALSTDDIIRMADDEAFGKQEDEDSEEKYYEATEFSCPQCGGTLVSDHDTAVTFCSYCGGSVVLEKRTTRLAKPDIIIPFKKTREECVKKYKEQIKMSLFAPKSMTDNSTIDRIRGIYMPYWIYDINEQGYYIINGIKSYRRGDYMMTDHVAFSCHADVKYTSVAFDASAAFSDRFSQAIGPFGLQDGVEFTEGCISGFYADAGDVQAEVYRNDAQEEIKNQVHEKMKNSVFYKGYSILNDTARLEVKTSDNKERLAYFPVWFLANRFKDKVSYAVINGQNGNVVADIPIDFKKYIFGSLILSLPIILFLNLFVYIKPGTLMFLALIFSLVSYYLADKQLDSEYARMLGLDDKGLQIRRYGNVQNPKAFATTSEASKVLGAIIRGLTLFLFVIALGALAVVSIFRYESAEICAFCIAVGYCCFTPLKNFMKYKVGAGTKTGSERIKRSFGEKLGVLIKPILAIVIIVVVRIINPIMDIWYYSASIASMILALISYADLVKLHNKLSMSVPPQFGKRGGDM